MNEGQQKRVSKRISRAVGKLCKRIFDLLASAIGLILLSPLLLAIAVFIKLKMPGPVLFRQERIGRNGKPFTIFKFRSMTLNHQGSTISVKGEKRITPLGAFLRKHKFDELPELWNVVCGDMSLVGPRPDMPGYANQLVGEEKLILKLRPGITGPASLKYANEEELLAGVADPVKYNDEIIWPDKVRINLDYYYNRSFLGDMLIIFKTIF
jgi:lipopolysaccharide/colanic/teichoic acid biosynthesis glycosyltransferase